MICPVLLHEICSVHGGSPSRAPVDEVMALTTSYRDRYQAWSAKYYYAWCRRPGRQTQNVLINQNSSTPLAGAGTFFIDESAPFERPGAY
jgi:hypothetical protein